MTKNEDTMDAGPDGAAAVDDIVDVIVKAKVRVAVLTQHRVLSFVAIKKLETRRTRHHSAFNTIIGLNLTAATTPARRKRMSN